MHYHFASVRALLTEAAVGVMRTAAMSLGPALAGARTPAEVVDLLVASLDEFTGRDPVSLLFIETYLAATRDQEVRDAVAGLVAEFRSHLAGWLGERGVTAPDATAAVLASAIDGLVLHRALDPSLAAGTVAPVLARLLEQGPRLLEQGQGDGS